MPTTKTVVHYIGKPMVGKQAVLWPIDHPTCSNQGLVRTSAVQRFDEASGTIETENTIYVPDETPGFGWKDGMK